MVLLDRLIGLEQPKISPHGFMAALAEYARGAFTTQQLKTALQNDPEFLLTAAELNQLDEFLSEIDGQSNLVNKLQQRMLIHDVLMLGEQGSYSRAQCKARLNLLT